MGRLVFVVSPSGHGKSYSLRNLDPNVSLIVNTDRKELPWRYTKDWNEKNTNYLETSDIDDIEAAISYAAEKGKKVVVIDTWNMQVNDLVLSENFRKQGKDYLSKWGDMAARQYQLFNEIRDNTPEDMYVYLLCHPEENFNEESGLTESRIAVHGGMLKKVRPESKSTIVLYAEVKPSPDGDAEFTFRTRTNGLDTCKSPVDMFPTRNIPNDLAMVDSYIRDYYHLEQIEAHAALVNTDSDKQQEE